jgi:hypothetical protein
MDAIIEKTEKKNHNSSKLRHNNIKKDKNHGIVIK